MFRMDYKEYYKKTSILDNIAEDTKEVFNKIIKIISNGSSKEIIKLLEDDLNIKLEEKYL